MLQIEKLFESVVVLSYSLVNAFKLLLNIIIKP